MAWADPAPEWKEYENPHVGIHLTVKRAWTEIFFKETAETGSVTFALSSQPHATVSIFRQKADYPFEVWVSSEVLLQVYVPGYKQSAPARFAGRSCIKVVGTSRDKEGRREETYFSSRPPFVDQITFSAPEEAWPAAEPDFAVLRKSIRWTR